MAKRHYPSATAANDPETVALAAFLAKRIAESVPSASTYQPAIADTLALALADAAAGRAVPDPDAELADRALD